MVFAASIPSLLSCDLMCFVLVRDQALDNRCEKPASQVTGAEVARRL
jgi:hypothetical protein